MLAEGELIAGRYRLHDLLGEGGMASVWRAEDLRLEREVAVKFLDTKSGRDASEATDQFLREAKIAAAVQHRNVIQTVDFGTTDAGQPFMVMELLRGRTLADRIVLLPPLPPEECVRIALLTLRGLAKVHEAGIVHRDLKPDNIFLVEDADGAFPKILDFGISRSVDPKSGRKSALTTSDGLIVGTPEYMSPEQARGLRDLDLRTDIYSMGVILYECLTGKRPYESEHTGDLIIMVVNGGAPPVIQLRPDIGQTLSDVVAKAMSRKRDMRFPDVRSMQRALEAAAATSLDDGIRRTHSMMPPAGVESDGLEYELPTSDPGAASTPERGAETIEVDAAASALRAVNEDTPHRNPSPTQRGIESWTESREISANPWPRRGALIGAVAAVLALGVWAFSPPDEPEVSPLAAAPIVPATPPPHIVELQGLLPGSTILLDGKAAEGPHVELPPGDEGRHTLQVLAPGKLPWFVVHGPGSQHRYDVIMTAETPSSDVAETKPSTSGATKTAATKTPSTKATRPRNTTKNPTRPTTKTPTKPPTAFHNLDF